jgi:hypothetical protein
MSKEAVSEEALSREPFAGLLLIAQDSQPAAFNIIKYTP